MLEQIRLLELQIDYNSKAAGVSLTPAPTPAPTLTPAQTPPTVVAQATPAETPKPLQTPNAAATPGATATTATVTAPPAQTGGEDELRPGASLGDIFSATGRLFTKTKQRDGSVGAAMSAGMFFFKHLDRWLSLEGGYPILIGLACIAAFIYINWTLPRKWMRKRAVRGDTKAAEWLPRVRKYGLPAVIACFVSNRRAPKAKRTDRRLCPNCNKSLENIEAYTDLEFVVCPHCRENVTPIYSVEDYVRHLVAQLEAKFQKTRGDDPFIERDAMTKLVKSVITMGIRRRGSDLHIEGHETTGVIRCRIDGMLQDLINFPPLLLRPMVSAMKVLANLDISERRVPQDGKFTLTVDKSKIDVRINTAPATVGEKASLRLLDARAIDVTFEGLGLEGDSLRKFVDAIHSPHGVFIITGPTGSGKTTSLYVALRQINTGEKNIVSIEDPVEYELPGISQMQVNNAQAFTFATGLRSILRQDPDVIMVGEIRDSETASIAVDAAITGHLVFTTLHTIDSVSVFPRLNDLGVIPNRYASALIAVVAQRLARTLCPECRAPYTPRLDLLERLGIEAPGGGRVYYSGGGCEYCNHTGFVGRVGLFEILQMNEGVRRLVQANASTDDISNYARQHAGMKTLREVGIERIIRGVTSVEEIVRVAK